MSQLSRGILQKLFHKVHTKADGPVVLQATAVKSVNVQGVERVRVKCSDGQFENQMAMFSGKIESLPAFSVFKMTNWNVSSQGAPDKTILQIESFDIIQQPAEVQNKKLGNPTVWKFTGEALSMETNFPKKTGSGANKENNKPMPEGGRYMAIQALTPYMNKWTIKGRITQKSDMREWNNARGSGKLFSFTIADETSDMKVTAFKDDAEKFIEMITKGKIYQITNGNLKAKNAQFNKTEHDYELTLNRNSVIDEMDDDDEVPKQRYNFIKINTLEQKEKFNAVDIIAIIKAADENVTMIHIKSRNEDSPKREISMVDDSMSTVKCTLWGDAAINFEMTNVGKVVALKDAVVGDFGGRSLSMGRNGEIAYGFKDDVRAETLTNWWMDAQSDNFNSLSQGTGGRKETIVPLSTLLAGDNFQGDKPYYFTCKGVVTFLRKENVLYKACPGKNGAECKKKLIDEGNGNFRCEKCDFTTPDFVYRMIVNAQIGDHSHSSFMTFFAEQGEQLLNIKSADLGKQMEEMEGDQFDNTMGQACFKEFIINARAKPEMYQDEQKIKITASKIADIDYIQYGNQLINEAVTEGRLRD